MNKIHIKKVLLDALRHFVALIVSCLGGYFISNGVFGLIGLLISNNNRLVFRLFYFVPYFAIVTIVLFLVSFKTEKKREKFVAYETAVSTIIACILQLFAALIITFAIYTSGPALPLAHIFHAGKDIHLQFLDTDVPNRLYIICMLVLDLFYICATIFGGFCGQKKRKKERDELHNETSKMKGESHEENN